MDEQPLIIYYLSSKLVDQLYRNKLGPFADKTKTIGVRGEQKISLKATMGRIFEALGGPGFTGEGQIQRVKNEVETLQIKGSVEERAARLLDRLLTRNQLRDIEEVVKDIVPECLYAYSLPTRISPKVVTGEPESFVEVSYNSDSLKFSGLTSKENWSAPSLRNNLLFAARKSPNKVVPTSGVISPLDVVRQASGAVLTVQYLLICHPKLGV